jgi:hypothetical protein
LKSRGLFFWLASQSGPAKYEISLVVIRAELMASVEKSGG